ncbi:MAG: F0F1 ATP synthase subunit delta, partial [Muribaculaceae bacterium]|nr:F0F1 ATP synthase subunit delta [Muribaculaceae bacterium]
RYAKALYKLAVERGNSDKVYLEMKTVANSFADNPGLQKILSNPYVKREDKAKLLISAAGDSVEDDYRSFVELILNRKRADFAHLMALAYCDIYRKEHKIARVRIITATKLDDSMMKKLRDVVEKAYPGMTLEFTYEVNPDLIGGFVIDVDDQRLDASISNEIEQLRLKLLRSN